MTSIDELIETLASIDRSLDRLSSGGAQFVMMEIG